MSFPTSLFIFVLISMNLLILALFIHIVDGFLDGRLKKKCIQWFDKKFDAGG